MIYLDNVSKKYRSGVQALKNINLDIKKGEFVSIVGFSGSGKTTLTRLILGELQPEGGKTFFNSMNIAELKQAELNKHRRNIGTIFQDYRLISNKTVYENIAFAMEVAGKEIQDIETDVPHVLKLVGLLKKTNSFPDELSGGEKQRTAIARAIVNNPDLIIADEPTGNLDPLNTADVIDILKKINSFGTTVILTTHDKEIVNGLRKRVITISSGIITKDDQKGAFIL